MNSVNLYSFVARHTSLPGAKDSGDTAVVACGDSSLTFNCVVAWASASPTGTYRTWWWQHFRVYYNGTYNFVFSNAFDSGYIVAGPPAVTYKGNTSSTCAWVFGWPSAGTTYYTRCKGVNELATLTAGTEVSHTPASGVMTWAPALGSVNAAAEVLAEWK
jgi:hypothetical protein